MRSGPVAAGHEVVGRREALVAPESATSAVAAVAAVATVATVASTVVRVRGLWQEPAPHGVVGLVLTTLVGHAGGCNGGRRGVSTQHSVHTLSCSCSLSLSRLWLCLCLAGVHLCLLRQLLLLREQLLLLRLHCLELLLQRELLYHQARQLALRPPVRHEDLLRRVLPATRGGYVHVVVGGATGTILAMKLRHLGFSVRIVTLGAYTSVLCSGEKGRKGKPRVRCLNTLDGRGEAIGKTLKKIWENEWRKGASNGKTGQRIPCGMWESCGKGLVVRKEGILLRDTCTTRDSERGSCLQRERGPYEGPFPQTFIAVSRFTQPLVLEAAAQERNIDIHFDFDFDIDGGALSYSAAASVWEMSCGKKGKTRRIPWSVMSSFFRSVAL